MKRDGAVLDGGTTALADDKRLLGLGLQATPGLAAWSKDKFAGAKRRRKNLGQNGGGCAIYAVTSISCDVVF